MSALPAAVLAALALALAVVILLPGAASVRRRRPPGPTVEAASGAVRGRPARPRPLLADAAAALLGSGASLETVLVALGGARGPAPELAVVGRLLGWGASWDEAWSGAPEHRALRDALELAASTGAPIGVLLRQAAADERRAVARHEDEEAAALTVRLVLPLGLCGLPAFICLGIVPLAIALMPWG